MAMDSLRQQVSNGLVDTFGVEQQWSTLATAFRAKRGLLRLLVVPELSHPIAKAAHASGDDLRVRAIVPDMPDDARRELADVLRQGNVDVLFVTAERFSDNRFVQFIQQLRPASLFIASAQRCIPENGDFWTPYESLCTLRGLLPNIPLIALADEPQSDQARQQLADRLGIPIAPMQAAQAIPPSAPQSVAPSNSTNPWLAAYPHFEREAPLETVSEALGKDSGWCAHALEQFIRDTGRTNPFPWVGRPDYLLVATIAGQADSKDPRIVLPIVGDRVPELVTRLALTALANRDRVARGTRN